MLFTWLTAVLIITLSFFFLEKGEMTTFFPSIPMLIPTLSKSFLASPSFPLMDSTLPAMEAVTPSGTSRSCRWSASVDKSYQPPTEPLLLRLRMRHYPLGGGHYQSPDSHRREVPVLPVHELGGLHGEPRRYDSALVYPAEKLHPQLAPDPVVDELELAYVALLLQHPEDLARQVRGRDHHAVLLVPHLGVLQAREKVGKDVSCRQPRPPSRTS